MKLNICAWCGQSSFVVDYCPCRNIYYRVEEFDAPDVWHKSEEQFHNIIFRKNYLPLAEKVAQAAYRKAGFSEDAEFVVLIRRGDQKPKKFRVVAEIPPGEVEFEIPGTPPTLNRELAMKLRDRMRSKSDWKQYVYYSVLNKRPHSPLERAKVTCIRYSSRRPDNDNLAGSFKHVIDGLVEAKILANDRHNNIGWPTYLWEKCPERDRKIRIIIEELGK